MIPPPDPYPAPYCHFCGKDQAEVRQLFSGPTAHICDECIEMAALIMASRVPSDAGGTP